MKIRSGFVSNSSSASFIVTFGATPAELYKQMVVHGWFTKEYTRQCIEESIQVYEDVLAEAEENNSAVFYDKKTCCRSIKELKANLQSLPTCTNEQQLFFGMQASGLRAEVNIFGQVEVGGWTSMWNGEESLPDKLTQLRNDAKKAGIKTRLMVFSEQ